MNPRSHLKEHISILIAEDSRTQGEEIRSFLEEYEYDVTLCGDGVEALEFLRQSEVLPDVVISDVVMPKMDGYAFCKAVRNDVRLKNLSVVLLTSLSKPQDIIKSIEAGANKFLTKPFDHKRLPEVIDELYINTKRRSVERMEMGMQLVFGGKEYLITADKVQILDLLLASYEESYYQNLELRRARSELEALNAELERKVEARTRQLKIQEEQFRTLAEHSPDLIVRIDRNMSLAYANSAVGMLLGVPTAELIGQPVTRLEETISNCPCTFIVNHLFSSGEEMRLEYDFSTEEGTKWIDSTFVPEFDEKGAIEYALKVARDITAQKEAEKLLYLKDQAIATSVNAIAIGDLEGNLTYVNEAFLKIWEYEKEDEVLGRHITGFWEDEAGAKEAFETLIENEKWVGEMKAKKSSGELFDTQTVAHSVCDQHGKVVSYMGFFTDITQSKQIEKELEEKDRMMLMQSKQAAMGEMIAMIAHQWRQPITVVSMVANNLSADLELGTEITEETLRGVVEAIDDQTQYLSKTIEDFRAFFKPTKECSMSSMGTVLDHTMKIIGKSLEDNGISVEMVTPSERLIEIYENDLIQVFLNILNNAKDAYSERGHGDAKIVITTKEHEGCVEVDICDNAGGIPDEIMERLSEPYFSTKGHNGTGLGLYMSKMIVEKHLGGSLSWSNKDEGACFKVVVSDLGTRCETEAEESQ